MKQEQAVNFFTVMSLQIWSVTGCYPEQQGQPHLSVKGKLCDSFMYTWNETSTCSFGVFYVCYVPTDLWFHWWSQSMTVLPLFHFSVFHKGLACLPFPYPCNTILHILAHTFFQNATHLFMCFPGMV